MPITDRRTVMQTAVAVPIAMAATGPAFPQTTGAAPGADANRAPAKGVTRALARYVVTATYDDLPANVRKEGVRTLLNWVGVAIGGSRHRTVEIAVAALSPFSGPTQAALLGRRERFDILNAAFINGVSSHIFDFDDTHLKTIIHPAGPVASAILALSEMQPISGKDFLNALILGVETECRIGNAVYPNHYDVGWHITGTAGVFGSAAAVGKLLNLNEQQMVWALGLAASQPVGLRESFGSMNKSFNPGRAASNGIFASVLASKNFTSSDQMIEAKRGWANTVSTKQDYREILDGLGVRYEALLNTYKPFACGIVMHPAIDAAIQLRNENQLTADRIERVELKVNLEPARRPGGQVQHLPRGCDCARRRRGRREAVQRSGGERSRSRRVAWQSGPRRYAGNRSRAGRHDDRAEGRADPASLHRARDRQRRSSDDGQTVGRQVR
jgi:hypothetical protein